MKKIAKLLLCAVLVASLLCACGVQKALTRVEAQEKLADFLEIFDYAEDKTYTFADDGETEIDGERCYRFLITWDDAGTKRELGSYLVSAADGSITPEE